MSKDLRSKLIRLAHAKPELRSELLPLLKMAGKWDVEKPLAKKLIAEIGKIYLDLGYDKTPTEEERDMMYISYKVSPKHKGIDVRTRWKTVDEALQKAGFKYKGPAFPDTKTGGYYEKNGARVFLQVSAKTAYANLDLVES